MRIDNSSTVGSIHIDNNDWFPFPWKFLADLEVSESKIIWEKDKKSIDFKIRNRGTVDSEEFVIEVYTKEKHQSPKLIEKFAITKLEKGKSIEKSFDITKSIQYSNINIDNIEKIIIKVDTNYEVKESNEKNNIKVITINKEEPLSLEDIDYTIKVKTGNIAYAGTDAHVYIKLYGSQGETAFMQLNNSRDNFEKNDTDTFIIHHKDIGHIEKISIKQDNSGDGAGWFLEKVEIIKGIHYYNFTAKQWLSHASRNIEPTITIKEDSHRIQYYVTIQTSSSKKAGTDANVYIQLFGQHGKKTPLQRIDKKEIDDFEKGDIGNYIVYADEDLGEIDEIKLEHDNTGDGAWWKINQISINNRYLFTINDWLGSDNKSVHPSKIFRR